MTTKVTVDSRPIRVTVSGAPGPAGSGSGSGGNTVALTGTAEGAACRSCGYTATLTTS